MGVGRGDDPLTRCENTQSLCTEHVFTVRALPLHWNVAKRRMCMCWVPPTADPEIRTWVEVVYL